MFTLKDLITQHRRAATTYSTLCTASRALNKRLKATQQAQRTILNRMAQLVGTLAVGQLVQTLYGGKCYEIAEIGPYYYVVYAVNQHTGATKYQLPNPGPNGPVAYFHIIKGGVQPVPPDHPIYRRWQKQQLRRALEGQR